MARNIESLAEVQPNKRLKLTGGDRLKGNGVLCAGAHELSFKRQMRRRAGRPQLKRGPLGCTPMHKHTVYLATTLVLLATEGAAHHHDPPWRVGLRNFGPVHYGMTLADASRTLGESLKVADPHCDYVAPDALPDGTALMVIEGRVERVDIDTAGILTRSSIGIGSTEEDVRRAYGDRIRTEPHPYTGPEGHYLIFIPRDPADSGFGIIFATDGYRVTDYRAGREPAVRYIEGCS